MTRYFTKTSTFFISDDIREIIALSTLSGLNNRSTYGGGNFSERYSFVKCACADSLKTSFVNISTESKTAEDFGHVMNLLTSDVEHLREIMIAVENGNTELLREMGIKESAVPDVKFFLDKLAETGFLSNS